MRAARCTCCFLVPVPDLRQNPQRTALTSTPDLYVSATYRGTNRLVNLSISKGFVQLPS